MGTIYYCLCHDCKAYVDLDKFYSFSCYEADVFGVRSHADIDKERLEEFGAGFVYRSLRLQYFMRTHTDHRLGVHTEHDVEKFDWYDDEDDIKWKEEIPWPRSGHGVDDTIDLTDPKVGRIVMKTRFGELYIDHRVDGLNCFRFDADGKRVDVMLLEAKK